MIISLVRRNLRLYFRDRASVFFSMLGVIIIVGLYALFLGDIFTSGVKSYPGLEENARFFLDSWLMGGVIAVASITTSNGAFGTMIDDIEKHVIKDFHSSPIKNSQLIISYISSTIIIASIMTFFTFVLAEVYILAYGGEVLSFKSFLITMILSLLSVCASSAFVFFIISFLKTMNAFSAVSMLLGTIIGFLTGIYIPIGQLPKVIQIVIKFFPLSHSAVLLRKTLISEVISLDLLPLELKETLGLTYIYFGKEMPIWGHIMVLVFTFIAFYLLAIIVVSKKKNHIS